MERLDRIAAAVDKLFDDRKAELETARENLQTAADAVPEYEKQMQAAKAAGDPDQYSEAKKNLQTAKDAAELYQEKLDELNAAPIITPAQYSKLEKATLQAIEAETLDTEKDLCERCEAMQTATETLRTDKAKAESTLQKVSTDLKHHKARGITEQIRKSAEAGRAINWGLSATDTEFYKGYCNRTGRTPKP